MSEFTVEKNKPVPQSGSGGPKYPWPKMEIGDSFLVPAKGLDEMEQVQRSLFVSGNGWCNRNAPHLKVVTRRDHSVPGVRVWLVEREGS